MMRKMLIMVLLLTAANADAAPASQPTTAPVIVRQPKYPPKDRRTLFTDQEIAQARENVARYPVAKAVAAAIVKEADEWAGWDDEKLAGLIPDASVPRAFDAGTAGCPRCGKLLYEKFGNP